MTYDVAIIGGGISGLTAAYDLQRQGRNVIVLERQQQIGGNAISERINGFLMEHGPTTLNTMVPQAIELTRELGIESQRVDLSDDVRKRYLREEGRLHGVRIHPAGFLLSPYLSWGGRLAVLSEMLRPPKRDLTDETIHAFTARRFGREFADKVMDPLAAGMLAGDSHRLSVAATFPKLTEMEQRYGSITRGIIHAKRNSEPGKRLFSFRNGVAALPQALAGNLMTRVKTGVAVKSVSYTPGGYEVKTYRQGTVSAKSVVLAVQPHVAAGLLEPLDDAAATAASNIEAPPMSVVFFAFAHKQVDHPLDSLGFLSVKDVGGIITGTQFFSTMFANRAPQGFVSFAAYVGGSRNREAACIQSDELVPLVQKELSDLLGIRGDPVVSRCRQWARSLPQYEIGHSEKVKTLEGLSLRRPGLYLTGNYLGGVSIANCIAQARKAAKEVNGYLCEVSTSLSKNVSAG